MDASFVFLLLVIVHNLNVVSVPFSPHEAETPLISAISTEDIYLADFAAVSISRRRMALIRDW